MLVPMNPKIKYLDLGTHALIERSALDRLLDRLETTDQDFGAARKETGGCAESLLHERERRAREPKQPLARRKRTGLTRQGWPVRSRKAPKDDV